MYPYFFWYMSGKNSRRCKVFSSIQGVGGAFHTILRGQFYFGDFLVIIGSFFGSDPCLFGRAEILVIFGLHFGRNDDLINSL